MYLQLAGTNPCLKILPDPPSSIGGKKTSASYVSKIAAMISG